jgi:hypothetical protein
LPGSQPPSARQQAVRALRQDAVTVEVVTALRAADIEQILLKGRVTERWLYGGELRPSGDVDLLLPGPAWKRAGACMRELGFLAGQPGWRGVSLSWKRREEGDWVDLHRSLFGLYAAPEAVWEELASNTEPTEIARVRIATLGLPARALSVAMHAAQHGFEGARKPVADLERALAQVDRETWTEAAELSRRLDGEAAFGAGLRTCENGRRLAAELSLPATRSLTVHLHATGAEPLVLGLESLAAPQSLGSRVRFTLRKLFPSPDYLRGRSRLARRGRAGLVLAYLCRPLWLAARLPRALLAWRRAKADLERAHDAQEQPLQQSDRR